MFHIFIYIDVFRWTLREKNVILKKENEMFSKQFVTTEPRKYGLKFSVSV